MQLRSNHLSSRFSYPLWLFSCIGFLPLVPIQATVAGVLPGCFSSPVDYQTNYSADLVAADNYTGKALTSTRLIGNGPTQTANCNCPSNMRTTTATYSVVYAGSPLLQGHATDYGSLSDAVDVQVLGYTDAVDSPTGTNLYEIKIQQYPTLIGSMASMADGKRTAENIAPVCSTNTNPNTPPAGNKREFKWNIINVKLYLKQSILGEEIIPQQIVAQYYACLADSPMSCTVGQAELASNVWFGVTLTAPLSCTINAGSTIEVNLGMLSGSSFVAQGQPPQGYTLRNVDISYHCDNPAVSNVGKIKMTLTADQGVSDSGTALIAKMINRDDIGVRMYDSNGNNVALDGSVDLPITLDSQGNGTVKMQAAPVSTSNTPPVPGPFEGNVTVKMDIK